MASWAVAANPAVTPLTVPASPPNTIAERGLSRPIQRAATGVPTITRIALINPVAIDSAITSDVAPIAAPVTGQGAGAFIYRLDSYQTQDTLDVYANGPFQLGGREHELVVGASTSRTHLNFPNYSSTLAGQDNDYGDVDNIVVKV